MKNRIDFQKLFEDSKNELDFIINKNNEITENDFLKIISSLSLHKSFFILENNTYNFEEISKLFRTWEDELKNSFSNDKLEFQKTFNCYVLLIEVLTELTKYFSTNIEKRNLIDTFFQYIKETLNMTKYLVPLEKEHIDILNNIIGEQLYYYTHLVHITTNNKDIDYLFDEYALSFERIVHGYELSLSTNFGNQKDKNKTIEYYLFINNASFFLLKMIHKIKHLNPNVNFYSKNRFKESVDMFHHFSSMHKNFDAETLDDFYDVLFKEFKKSCNQLNTKLNYNIINEKIKLLSLNIDEYKQLIDIISSINHKETAGKTE